MDRRKQVLLDLHPDKASLNNLTDDQKKIAQEKLKKTIISFKFIKDYLIKKKLDDYIDEQKDEWEEYIVLEKLPITEYQEKVWIEHNKVQMTCFILFTTFIT